MTGTTHQERLPAPPTRIRIDRRIAIAAERGKHGLTSFFMNRDGTK